MARADLSEVWPNDGFVSRWTAGISAMPGSVVLAVGVLSVVAFITIFAQLIMPFAFDQMDLRSRHYPPLPLAESTYGHTLGTDKLGRDIRPPMTSLGQMLGEGRDYLVTAWWLAVVPGVMIFVTTLSMSILGDWLRTRFDPLLQD